MNTRNRISIGITAFLLATTGMASDDSADADPNGQARQRHDVYDSRQTQPYPQRWPDKPLSQPPARPGSGETRHLRDHDGYRPGNW